jgi:hypothetical protein
MLTEEDEKKIREIVAWELWQLYFLILIAMVLMKACHC